MLGRGRCPLPRLHPQIYYRMLPINNCKDDIIIKAHNNNLYDAIMTSSLNVNDTPV